MVIEIILIITGIATNVVVLMQPLKAQSRFTETCTGCGGQAPPVEYPPAVHQCLLCDWKQHRATGMP
jgi:hypothetical protein